MTRKLNPKTSLSNFDLAYRRPTLCGYCHRLAAPMYTKFQGKTYGGCSLDHLNKIQRGEKMQDIKNFAQINDEGLDYALDQAKEVYLEEQQKTGAWKTTPFHNWTREQRINFVHRLVRSYLNHAHHQAKTGESKSD